MGFASGFGPVTFRVDPAHRAPGWRRCGWPGAWSSWPWGTNAVRFGTRLISARADRGGLGDPGHRPAQRGSRSARRGRSPAPTSSRYRVRALEVGQGAAVLAVLMGVGFGPGRARGGFHDGGHPRRPGRAHDGRVALRAPGSDGVSAAQRGGDGTGLGSVPAGSASGPGEQGLAAGASAMGGDTACVMTTAGPGPMMSSGPRMAPHRPAKRPPSGWPVRDLRPAAGLVPRRGGAGRTFAVPAPGRRLTGAAGPGPGPPSRRPPSRAATGHSRPGHSRPATAGPGSSARRGRTGGGPVPALRPDPDLHRCSTTGSPTSTGSPRKRPSRSATGEPDTLVYVIHLVPNAPMQRIFYEIYRDRAAFESHENQPYTQRFVAERRSLRARDQRHRAAAQVRQGRADAEPAAGRRAAAPAPQQPLPQQPLPK